MRKKEIIEIVTSIWECADQRFCGYIIGGAALTVYGVQENTKDIDIIFNNNDDRCGFVRAASKLGYTFTSEESVSVLSEASEKPIQIYGNGIYIDLFNRVTTHFCLTNTMQMRSRKICGDDIQGMSYLNAQDILLMKSATGRNSDVMIASRILDCITIDWNEEVDEVLTQIDCGMKRAAYNFLELLQDRLLIKRVPKSVYNELIKLTNTRIQQISEICL